MKPPIWRGAEDVWIDGFCGGFAFAGFIALIVFLVMS